MTVCQAQLDETGGPGGHSMNDALVSLERALQILDDCDAPAHIGARLQDLINLVADDSATSASGERSDEQQA